MQTPKTKAILTELTAGGVVIRVNYDFSLTVHRKHGTLLWETSRSRPPAIVVYQDQCYHPFPFRIAQKVSILPFEERNYRGTKLLLSGFASVDLGLELILAIDSATDEVLVQVAQVGGSDKIVEVEHLYRFEKPVAQGGYIVVPHGSGYLIPAESPDEIPGQAAHGGLIGARWTLPLFGIVRDEDSLYAIVESWWNCSVQIEHVPRYQSVLDFRWVSSLGSLSYPRRLLLGFGRRLDYVGLAKLYRNYARSQGLLRTLTEKSAETPVIRRYINNVLFRYPAWNTKDGAKVLDDIRRLQKMDLEVSFFFPKWSSAGYNPTRDTATTTDAGWQAYLQDSPVPGGWETLADYADAVHKLGCPMQTMINMWRQVPDAPDYDEQRWPQDASGGIVPRLSGHDSLQRLQKVLGSIASHGFKPDVFYFDGYSAHAGLPEDFSPLHPVTRRQTFEQQSACFRAVRDRGMMPGAELPRFWCMAECDFFFFSDWSDDRLSNRPNRGAPAHVGVPVPLFQLVFHDCYIAGFSGGGYALYMEGFDWWANRTPRLYELLFAAMPAHNWLPNGHVPVRDWDSPFARRRWAWLKRWSDYYRNVALSEMVSHRFLSLDWQVQQVEFANGIVAEFNMAANQLRVEGVSSFSGKFETPEELRSTAPNQCCRLTSPK